MKTNTDFPIADLSPDQLKKVQALEEELRNSTENIILIAYQSDK